MVVHIYLGLSRHVSRVLRFTNITRGRHTYHTFYVRILFVIKWTFFNTKTIKTLNQFIAIYCTVSIGVDSVVVYRDR